MDSEKPRLVLHFFYCTVFLVFCLVLVATDRWTEKNNFTEYLTNAATMVSLVLGLVAIFYSFIANDGLSKSLGNISQVSSEVAQTKGEISEYLKLTREAVKAGEKSEETMRSVSSGVNATLSSLSAAMDAINTQTNKLHESMDALPTRFDKLETTIKETNRKLGEKGVAPSTTPPKADKSAIGNVTRFLEISSLSANLFTYACVLAHRRERQLSIRNFCDAVGLDLTNYFNGFRACMHATDLIDSVLVPDTTLIFTVKKVHPELSAETESYINAFIDRNFKDKPEVKASWRTKLVAVEAL